MASTVFGVDFINQCDPYWYERAPFTAVNSIAALQSVPVVGSVSGWNGNFAKDIAFLESIAATQDPNVLLTLNLDGQLRYVYADTLRSDLLPVRTSTGMYQSFSLTAANQSALTATANTQLLYTMAVWRAPVAYKILRGFPLTPDENALAAAVNLPTNNLQEQGIFPLPIESYIERTYENRITKTTLEFAGPDPTAAVVGAPFYSVSAAPNELLVLRSIGCEVSGDYGLTLTLARDNQPTHLQLDPSLLSLDQPVDCFIPATQTLTFSVSAVTPPPSVVPFRFEIWHLAMDITLSARVLGPQSNYGLQNIQGLLGDSQGLKTYQQLLAGIR